MPWSILFGVSVLWLVAWISGTADAATVTLSALAGLILGLGAIRSRAGCRAVDQGWMEE